MLNSSTKVHCRVILTVKLVVVLFQKLLDYCLVYEVALSPIPVSYCVLTYFVCLLSCQYDNYFVDILYGVL